HASRRHAFRMMRPTAMPGSTNRPEGLVKIKSPSEIKNHQNRRCARAGQDSPAHAIHPAIVQTIKLKNKVSPSNSCSYHKTIGIPAHATVTGMIHHRQYTSVRRTTYARGKSVTTPSACCTHASHRSGSPGSTEIGTRNKGYKNRRFSSRFTTP